MRNSLKTSSGDFIDKAPMHIPKKTPSRPHYLFLAKVCNYISFISKYPLQKMAQQHYCFERGRAQVARYHQDGGNFIAASNKARQIRERIMERFRIVRSRT